MAKGGLLRVLKLGHNTGLGAWAPGGRVRFDAGLEEECPVPVGPEEAQEAQEARAAFGPS